MENNYHERCTNAHFQSPHKDGLKGNKGVPGRWRCVFINLYHNHLRPRTRTERQLKMVCSLLITPPKVPNVGRPSSWPGQLGTIIWTELAVQRQQENSNMHETAARTRVDTVLVSLFYFVCFIFCRLLSWCSSSHCCIMLELEDKGNAHMNSLYGKMGLHMVRIMWSEWSDWSQIHFECIQTYGYSFGGHQTVRMCKRTLRNIKSGTFDMIITKHMKWWESQICSKWHLNS